MIKAKKIGLILNEEITLTTKLKNGMVVSVICEFIEADYDRLYLLFPPEKETMAQYFYEGKNINIHIDTIDNRLIYSGKILYEPENNIIVVEYEKQNNLTQKRNDIRVKASKFVDILTDSGVLPMISIDISAGGMRLLSSQSLEQGNNYRGFLTLCSREPKIEFEIKVLQVKFLNLENKYEINTEFINISNSSKKAIAKFCFDTQTAILKEEDINIE